MCPNKRSKSQSGDLQQDSPCGTSHFNDSMTVKEQSIERMCSDEPSESKSDDAKNCVSSYKPIMTVKDAEHSSPSCSSSEADLSDAYKQEVNENGQCPLCNEIFSKASEFTLHLKKHTDGTKCLVCGKILSSANSLDRHLLVHSGEKPFECETCGKAFTTNGNMNRHKKKRKHFNKSSSDPPAKRAKIVPVNPKPEKANSPSVNTTKRKLHECEKCSDRFLNLAITNLPPNYDLFSRMDCQRRKTCPSNTKEIDKSSDDVEPLEVCNSCGDLCLRISNLHSETESKELYLCDYCDSGFISKLKFQIHKACHVIYEQHRIMNVDIRDKDDKDRFLQILGLLNANKMDNILSQKETNDIREEPMKLKNSPLVHSALSYPNNSNLQPLFASTVVSLSSKPTRNVTSPLSADCASPPSIVSQAPASPIGGSIVPKESTTDSELPCKQSGENIKSKKLSAAHSREALLKRKIKCPQCNYECKDKSTLTRHTRKHTGEKPFKCIICIKYFTTLTNTKRHVTNTHGIPSDQVKLYIECQLYEKDDTKCQYCRKDFGDPKSLRQHKFASKVCLGKEFVCSECSQRFVTKNNCLRHMMNIHKKKKSNAEKSMITDRFDSEGNQEENDEELQRIENDEELQRIENDEELQRIENDEELQRIENEEELQRIENDEELQRIENDEELQRIENEELQRIENEEELQRIENEEELQRIENNEELQKIESDEELQEIENDEQLQRIENDEQMQRIENNEQLQRIELILDATHCAIAPDSSSILRLETATQEQKPEKNENFKTDKENIPIIREIESNDMAIDMSKNSSKLENATSFQYPSIDTVRQRPSSTEVDVSYSMLRLSEELPHTQEPLDLSIRAIDLSSKIERSNQNSDKINSCISSHSTVPPPAHTSSLATFKKSSHDDFRNSFRGLPAPFKADKFMFFSPMSDFVRQNASFNNSVNNTEDSSDSEKELRIVEDPMSEVSTENTLIPINSRKQYTSDSEINDLASVSSVIDTANSQDISKFLKPVTFSKSRSAIAELGTLSLVPEANVCRNQSDNKKKSSCKQCNKSFNNTSALKRHLVTHSDQKLYACSICSKAFNTKSNCKRHELKFHSPKNGQVPKNSSAEQQSTSNTSGNKADFSKFSMATNRMSKNDRTNELPQNNSICSKTFNTKSNCKRQELKFHSQKNGQASKDSSSEHQSTSDISGNKANFSKFSMATNQMNKNDHTNELPQNNLGRFFNTRHIDSMYNNVPFSEKYSSNQQLKCTFCSETYKNSNDLLNHMKELHPFQYSSFLFLNHHQK